MSARRGPWPALAVAALTALGVGACFDRADRWLELPGPAVVPPRCTEGAERCLGDALERCVAAQGGNAWEFSRACESPTPVCSPALGRCVGCQPGATRCAGNAVEQCAADGQRWSPLTTCDATLGLACRGSGCVNLCSEAARERNNLGCEYFAVDLDNANVGPTTNAASQQFALVVSNPQPDLPAAVVITQNDAPHGAPVAATEVARAEVPPLGLRVFRLGPREVDGSPPGEFDTGSHTAWSRQAFRLESTVPVVVVQFNPLENVNVFSNDASLLKPVASLAATPGTLAPAYVVLGWPQTIASTDDPETNFSPTSPIDLRAFLTVVGTQPDTRVRVHPSTRILGAPGTADGRLLPVPETLPGGVLEVTLQPFDVLNLESDDFLGDFTGTLVEADQPVVAFSGSEASDAPHFTRLFDRRCCADHLEEQLDPVRTAGKEFVATVSANRTDAVARAGASLGVTAQAEYFRVIAVTPAGARITTTLPGADAAFTLAERGVYREIVTDRDFVLRADAPVMLASVSPSQDAADVTRGLPGGDPSLLVIPPVEQFRSLYVFLTPDKYAFDFLRIIAPPGASLVLDGVPLADLPECQAVPGDGLTELERGSPTPPWVVHRCQLSFPVIDPTLVAPANVLPGSQNDGVHRLEANTPVGVLVDGFDSYVSYAYAAGTELELIVPE